MSRFPRSKPYHVQAVICLVDQFLAESRGLDTRQKRLGGVVLSNGMKVSRDHGRLSVMGHISEEMEAISTV